ncbi:hypothetical protein TSUD_38430 [Trifolium subterraneum]|uniref:Uncharacterized protein n=1 Tax=Trifolium subterraneum TaxID=3900 RepID=A0A2Z6MG46_TRISU|nr:hypothetical protein TSUD_38430 [Trifolium subterraneum]
MSNSTSGSNSNQSCKQGSCVDSYESTLLSPIRVNNLNSIISSLSPCVAINFSSEPKTEGSRTSEYAKQPYFVLEDLGFSTEENGTFETTKAKVAYQYVEFDLPYERQSFNDKVSTLAMENPCIKNYRSCDLSPCSWFSVAWYPIYRIPIGSTLKNLGASFLTFHNLSTHFIGKNQSEWHSGSLKMSLPIFGLATYKLKGSILTLPEASESQRLNSLLKAADVWLQNLKVPVYHHDHSHFTKNGKQWIEE